MGFQPTDTAAVAGMPHDGDESDLLARAARAADKAAQEARSKKYHIAIKEGGAITKPSAWADLPDSAWGDPVNYRYPMKDKAHADNAAARWGDASNREQYSPSEQRIIGERIQARQQSFGEEKSDDGKDKERAASIAGVPGAELAGTLYAPFVRRDDSTWEVEGVLTSEDIDTYGTIFDYESAKRAVADWAGNVREQHDPTKAVGRRVEYECDDDNRLVKLRVRVSKGAPDTWAKVVDGTLSGFSIGAYNARRETRSVNGRPIPVYKDYSYGEVSLVDAPSNPAAARSGLTICRAAGFTASGQTEWNDAVLATFDTPDATPGAPVAASTETPAGATPLISEPVTRAEGAPAGDSASPASSAEVMAALESAVGPLSSEQRAAIAAAAGRITGQDAAAAATAVTAPAPALTRASIDLASGAAFQGNDLATPANRADESIDDGSDPERPVGKAMLDETGHAHDTHTHPHGSEYGSMHVHAHEHTHQDGTTHSHPHMHNHAHHDHYGDMGHSHPHTHIHDHFHDFRSAAPDLSKVSEPYPDGTASAKTVVTPESPDAARAAAHGPFTGTHSHAHPAFGSQGDDQTHEHEHAHHGDANHDHEHEDEARMIVAETDLERAAKRGKLPVTPANQKVNAAIADVLAALDTLKAAQASDETDEGKPVSAQDKGVDAAIQQAYAALAKIRTAQEQDVTHDAKENDDGQERAATGGVITTTLPPDVGPETLERAGARISAATSNALHQSALGILLVCGCPACQDAASLLNPDDDDDGGMDDGADDADERARQGRILRMQRVRLTRATRKAVASEVQMQLAPMQGLIQQMRGIAARLTAVNGVSGSSGTSLSDGGDASVKSQLDELRASMGAVQGLVEQIAAQPAPGGPILRAVDKTLGQYAPAHALDASMAPQAPTTSDDLPPEQLAAAIRQLQRSGALAGQDAQVNAAATLLHQQMRRQ